MKHNKPFPTENHKDHFIYDNQPFINPDHGKLYPIEWATVIDINLMPPTNPDDDDFVIAPEYYLQVKSNGEIRGVTHSYDTHEEYFSVTAGGSDVVFLKLFSNQYPHLTPTLASLQHYRKERALEWKKEVKKQKHYI
ncbi:hypothetical protein [Pseudomonas putida]|uniref:hypothetical protein n=1 Tax=Pseudomonas putida TaxID=303 RepID=UPI00111C8F56|nr:hypothetical protein [Pseudomonas putida]